MLVFSIFVAYIFTLRASNASKYVFSNEKVSFLQGFIRCKQNGLDPVEILSDEQEHEVEKELSQLKAGSDWPSYWIFATRMENSENYVWLNSGKPLLYSNFNVGEPNNLNNSEQCAEIFKLPSGNSYKWNDSPCEFKRKFICQTRSRDCQFPNSGDGTIDG